MEPQNWEQTITTEMMMNKKRCDDHPVRIDTSFKTSPSEVLHYYRGINNLYNSNVFAKKDE